MNKKTHVIIEQLLSVSETGCDPCLPIDAANLINELSEEIIRLRSMIATEQTQYPVLNCILAEHIEKGARIEKQDGKWHLFANDGNGLAVGETISSMLCNLILCDGFINGFDK